MHAKDHYDALHGQRSELYGGVSNQPAGLGAKEAAARFPTPWRMMERFGWQCEPGCFLALGRTGQGMVAAPSHVNARKAEKRAHLFPALGLGAAIPESSKEEDSERGRAHDDFAEAFAWELCRDATPAMLRDNFAECFVGAVSADS